MIRIGVGMAPSWGEMYVEFITCTAVRQLVIRRLAYGRTSES